MKTILFQGDSITDCGRYRKETDKKKSSVALFKKDIQNVSIPQICVAAHPLGILVLCFKAGDEKLS